MKDQFIMTFYYDFAKVLLFLIIISVGYYLITEDGKEELDLPQLGKAKQYEVIFRLQFNSVTLKRAAEAEKIIREQFHDACELDIEINEISHMFQRTSNDWTSVGDATDSLIFTDTDTFWTVFRLRGMDYKNR